MYFFFFSGLTIQANMYYKMLIGWTSQKIKDTHSTHNAFDFKNGDIFISRVLRNFNILFHMWIHINVYNNDNQAFYPLGGTGGLPYKNATVPLFCDTEPCFGAFLLLRIFFIFNSLYSWLA
jgi:hypothetical protein